MQSLCSYSDAIYHRNDNDDTEMLNVGCYDSMLGRQDSYGHIFGVDDTAPDHW
jgi:hypothetical protein